MSEIRLTCTCGASLKVTNPALRGKKLKCPRCSAPLVVPADAPAPARERVAPAPPPVPTSAAPFADLDEPAAPADPPRTRGKEKSSLPLILGVVAGLALLGLLGVGGLVVGYFWLRSKPAPQPVAGGTAVRKPATPAEGLGEVAGVGGGPGPEAPVPGGRVPAGPMLDPEALKPQGGVASIQALVGAQRDFRDVRPGDAVKIVGECLGLRDGKVDFHDARRYRGYRPSTPATDLAREYATDPAAADRKYKNKILVVEGMLIRLGDFEVELSASKPPSGPPAGKPGPGDDLLARKPDFTLSAAALQAELTQGGRAGKYMGKVVEVTGTVQTFLGRRANPPVVMLETGGEILGLQCAMADEEPWATLAKGQTVRLRGVCLEGLVGALSNCVVVEEGPSPAVRITAEQLAAEHAADKEAAEKKYTGKTLLISGEVASRGLNDLGYDEIFLKVKEGPKVSMLLLLPFPELPGQEMKVGDEVRASGQYDYATEEEIQLTEVYYIFGPEP